MASTAALELLIELKDSASAGIGKIADSVGGLGSIAATGGVALLGTAIVGIGTAAFNMSSDVKSATNDLQAQLGVTASEADNLSQHVVNIFGNNWGTSIDDVNQSLITVKQQMQSLGEGDLEGATQAAIALRDTFGIDVAESTNAANTLMKDFGLTSQQAFDFIVAGNQKGMNASGDFLETIGEYSTQFASGGASADQFFSLLDSGLQGGVLGTDKAADAFKEFRVRIQDGSKTTSDGLKALGIDADDLAQKMASGQMTAAQAFELVTGKLAGTTDKTVQMQAGVALLGTQFEDLGTQGALALSMTGTSMSDLTGATDSLNAKYNDFGSMFTGVWRQAQVAILPVGDALLDLGNQAMPFITDAIQKAIPYVTQFFQWLTSPDVMAGIGVVAGAIMEGLGGALQLLIGWITTIAPLVIDFWTGLFGGETTTLIGQIGSTIRDVLVGAFQFLGEAANFLAPIIQNVWNYLTSPEVISTITNLAGIIGGLLVGAWNTLVGVFNFVMPLIQQVWAYLTSPEVISTITNIATAVGSALVDAFNMAANVFNFLVGVFTAAWPTIQTLFQAGLEFVLNLWNATWPGLQMVLEGVWTAITGVIQGAWGVIQGIWNTATSLLKGDWEGAWNGILQILEGVWTAIQGVVEGAWQVLSGYLQQALGVLKTVWEVAWGAIKSFIEPIWEGIKTFVSNAIDAVKTTITNVTTTIKTTWETVWNAVKSFVETTWNGIKTGVQNAIDAVKTTITNVTNAIKTGWETVWNAVSSFIGTLWEGIKTTVSNAIEAVKTAIGTTINNIKTGWETVWNAISSFVGTLWDGVKTTIGNAIDAVKTKINEVLENVKTIWSNAWNAVVTKIGEVVTSVGTKLGEIVGAITTAAGNALNEAGKIGSNIISGIMGALEAGKQAVINFILGIAQGAVDAVKNFFGIHSPSRVMYELFSYVLQGANNAIVDGAKASGDVVGGWMEDMYDVATDKLGDIKDVGRLWDKSLAEGIGLNTDLTSDQVRSLVGKTVSDVNESAPAFASACYDYGRQGALALSDGFAGASGLLAGQPVWHQDQGGQPVFWNGITTGGSGRPPVMAASGFEGWVKRATPFMIGEGHEDEYVSITPRSQLAGAGAGLVFTGDVIIQNPYPGMDLVQAGRDVIAGMSEKLAKNHRLTHRRGR